MLDNLIGIKKTVIILGAMRKQRNVADYSEDIVPESAVVSCIAQAGALLKVLNSPT
jgi:hypothetical protein